MLRHFAVVLVALGLVGCGASPPAKQAATATPAPSVAVRVDPIPGGCPVTQPVKVTADKLAYDQNNYFYDSAQPVACFTTLQAAVKAGNAEAPDPSLAAATATPTPTSAPTKAPTQTATKPPPAPTQVPFTGTITGALSAPDCGGGYNLDNAAVVLRDEHDTIIATATTSAEYHNG